MNVFCMTSARNRGRRRRAVDVVHHGRGIGGWRRARPLDGLVHLVLDKFGDGVEFFRLDPAPGEMALQSLDGTLLADLREFRLGSVLLGIAALGALTFPLAFAFFIFEVGLVATLQAFIFSTLSAIYIGGATSADH